MATTTTFDYGDLHGAILETPKTDMKTFDYGALFGAIVGLNAAAAPAGNNLAWQLAGNRPALAGVGGLAG